MDEFPHEVLLTSAEASRAEEWSLVLSSQGIGSRTLDRLEGRELWVRSEDEGAARRALLAYASDPPLHARPPESVPGVTAWDWRLGAFAAAAVIELYFFSGPVTSPHGAWFARGDCGWELLGREPWRAITALTLHADASHLVANAVFAIFFFGAVGSRFGRGIALGLVLVGGVLGNVAASAWHGDGYHLIGASTAVFAAMGLTGGALAVDRAAAGSWARPLVPLGLAVCFLAYFGADPDSAIAAHVFGALAGLLLGGAVGMMRPRPAGGAVQLTSGAGAVALVVLAWWLALRGR